MVSLMKNISEIQNFYKEYRKIYIYGAGEYGKLCKRLLDYLRIPVEAIFVTELCSTTDLSIEGVPVIQWDKSIVQGLKGEGGIIVAISKYYEVTLHIKDFPHIIWLPPASSMIEITTKIGCSVECKYCPQKKLIDAYYKRNSESLLKIEDYAQILENIPPLTLIRFCGMCEPFLNPKCADMIVYAKKKGFRVDCYSTLVGLDINDVEKVLDAVDDFVPHIPDKNGNAIIEVSDEYIEKLKKVLEYKRNGKRLIKNLSVHGEIHDKVKNLIPDDVDIASRMQDRAGNLDNEGMAHYLVEAPIACGFNFNRLDSNILLPNGDLLMCCMDYSTKHIFGNLLNDPYEKILKSEEANRVRESMIYGTQRVLCNTCGFAEELLG